MKNIHPILKRLEENDLTLVNDYPELFVNRDDVTQPINWYTLDKFILAQNDLPTIKYVSGELQIDVAILTDSTVFKPTINGVDYAWKRCGTHVIGKYLFILFPQSRKVVVYMGKELKKRNIKRLTQTKQSDKL